MNSLRCCPKVKLTSTLFSLCLLSAIGFWSLAVPLIGRAQPTPPRLGEQKTTLEEARKLQQEVGELINRGDYKAAVPLSNQALTIFRQLSPDYRSDLAVSLRQRGFLYEAQGKTTEAEKFYWEALYTNGTLGFRIVTRYRKKPEVANDEKVEISFTPKDILEDKLSSVLLLGSTESSEFLSDGSIKLQEQTRFVAFPRELDVNLISLLLNLGTFYYKQKRYKLSEAIFEGLLIYQLEAQSFPSIKQKVILPQYFVRTLAMLTRTRIKLSKIDALDRPNLPESINSLTYALLRVSSDSSSSPLRDTAIPDYLHQGLVFSADIVYSTIWLSTQSGLKKAEKLTASQLALSNLLLFKGRVMDILADSMQDACHSSNIQSKNYHLCVQLDEVNRNLSQLTYRLQQENSSVSEYEKLQNERRSLEYQIRLNWNGRSTTSFSAKQIIPLVQTQIPQDAALVEIVKYNLPKTASRLMTDWWDREHYAAAILHSNGDSEWIDLGDAEKIDLQIEDFRQALRTRESDVKQIARKLDAKLMQPIRGL